MVFFTAILALSSMIQAIDIVYKWLHSRKKKAVQLQKVISSTRKPIISRWIVVFTNIFAFLFFNWMLINELRNTGPLTSGRFVVIVFASLGFFLIIVIVAIDLAIRIAFKNDSKNGSQNAG